MNGYVAVSSSYTGCPTDLNLELEIDPIGSRQNMAVDPVMLVAAMEMVFEPVRKRNKLLKSSLVKVGSSPWRKL